MWVSVVVIGVMVALAFLVGVRQAALFMSTVLVGMATVRALSPPPGPYGIRVRSRGFDVTVLLVFSAAIAALALTMPAVAI